MTNTPEQRARQVIDANLDAAGWLVQGLDDLDLTAGRCDAARRRGVRAPIGVESGRAETVLT